MPRSRAGCRKPISLARAGVRSALCAPLLGRTPVRSGRSTQIRCEYAGRFSPEQVRTRRAFAAHAAARPLKPRSVMKIA